MPIEFHCDQCQQRLQVPDDSAGKQAQCPNCSAILTVPAQRPRSSAFDTTVGPEPNPYAAPAAAPAPAPSASGEMSHQQFDAGYALTCAWHYFKHNVPLLILSYAIIFGASIVGSAVQEGITAVANQLDSPLFLFASIGWSIVSSVVQGWLTLGMIRICFAVVRAQPTEIGMIFSGGPWLLRYIGASILFGIAVFVGFLLLVIPGIYFLVTYWSYVFFIVDRDVGVFEAFQLAGEYGSGNRLNALVLGLIAFGLSVLGFLACFVGLLVTVPLATLMATTAYLMMTGQFSPGSAQQTV